MRLGFGGWRWDPSGDFKKLFSILAALQDCYPFGQEVALELAAEPGTACSGHGDKAGRRQMAFPWSIQTGCVPLL